MSHNNSQPAAFPMQFTLPATDGNDEEQYEPPLNFNTGLSSTTLAPTINTNTTKINPTTSSSAVANMDLPTADPRTVANVHRPGATAKQRRRLHSVINRMGINTDRAGNLDAPITPRELAQAESRAAAELKRAAREHKAKREEKLRERRARVRARKVAKGELASGEERKARNLERRKAKREMRKVTAEMTAGMAGLGFGGGEKGGEEEG